VDTSLGDNVHVEAVAQVDRVDVVAFQVRVHDGEEHLQEEVDGIDQDSKEEQPEQMLAAVKAASLAVSQSSYQASPVILAVLRWGYARSRWYSVS